MPRQRRRRQKNANQDDEESWKKDETTIRERMRNMQEYHQDERVGEDNEEGVDENGFPLYGREVEMYDEAAALLQRRYNPCWMASWG